MSESKRGFNAPKPAKRRVRAKRAEGANVEAEVELPAAIEEADSGAPVEALAEMTSEPLTAEKMPPETTSRATSGETSPSHRLSNPSHRGSEQGTAKREDPHRYRAGDEYSLQSFYDKASQKFIATVVEFPELKATGTSRDQAVAEIERKIETQVTQAKRRNESLPEAVGARRYPERLELALSQGLFRKLDLLSRQEKVSLDQLVVELISAGAEKRTEPPKQAERRPPQQQHQQQSHGNQQQQRHSHQRGGRQGQNRSYHDTMDNRENFMEYVRSLEKGNFRKK
jgi:predicted RNase H-like HicB family nuclease